MAITPEHYKFFLAFKTFEYNKKRDYYSFDFKNYYANIKLELHPLGESAAKDSNYYENLYLNIDFLHDDQDIGFYDFDKDESEHDDD